MRRKCIFIFGMIGVLALHEGISSTAAASPEPLTCKTLTAAQKDPLPPGKKVEKTEAELTAIEAERTCFKTYPWPPKLMVVEDKLGSVTPEEMRSIKDEVEAMVIEYRQFGKTEGRRRHGEKDFVATRFYLYGGVESRDLKLLQKFGDALYIQVLVRNGLLDEAKAVTDQAFMKWSVSVKDVPWDKGDEYTYFSDATLDKILFLLRYYVYARNPPASRKEALDVAEEYFRARPLLANEINLLGDPGEDLLENAGCR